MATIEATVQFDEVDSFRIAHHSRLIAFLERARLRLLLDLGLNFENIEIATVVYSMQVDFKKPAHLLDKVLISSELIKNDGCRLVLSERIVRQGQLLLKSKTTLVFFEILNGMPVPVASVYPTLEEFGV